MRNGIGVMELGRHDEASDAAAAAAKAVSDAADAKAAAEKVAADAKAAGKTQAEIDAIVEARLARERAKFSDYDDLKDKAKKFAELEAAKLSDLEKETAARVAAEARAVDAETRAQKAALHSAIVDAARVAGAVDPSDVVALLAPDAVTIDKDGVVTGAADAVSKLLAAKPHLKGASKPAGDIDQGGRGGKAVDYRTADPAVVRAELAKHGIAPRN